MACVIYDGVCIDTLKVSDPVSGSGGAALNGNFQEIANKIGQVMMQSSDTMAFLEDKLGNGLDESSNKAIVKAGNGIEVTAGGVNVKPDGSSISVSSSGVKLSGTYVAADGLEQGPNTDQIKVNPAAESRSLPAARA